MRGGTGGGHTHKYVTVILARNTRIHLHHIFEKLRVSNRDELTSFAQTRALMCGTVSLA